MAIVALAIVALCAAISQMHSGRAYGPAEGTSIVSNAHASYVSGALLMDPATISIVGLSATFDLASLSRVQLIAVPFIYGANHRVDVIEMAKWSLRRGVAIDTTHSMDEFGLINVAVPFEGWWGALLFDAAGHRACSNLVFIPFKGAAFCEELCTVNSLKIGAASGPSMNIDPTNAAKIIRVIARDGRFMFESWVYSWLPAENTSSVLWCGAWGVADIYWYGDSGCLGVAPATMDASRDSIRAQYQIEAPAGRVVTANITDDDQAPILVDRDDPFVFHILGGRTGVGIYVPHWIGRPMCWLTY